MRVVNEQAGVADVAVRGSPSHWELDETREAALDALPGWLKDGGAQTATSQDSNRSVCP